MDQIYQAALFRAAGHGAVRKAAGGLRCPPHTHTERVGGEGRERRVCNCHTIPTQMLVSEIFSARFLKKQVLTLMDSPGELRSMFS